MRPTEISRDSPAGLSRRPTARVAQVIAASLVAGVVLATSGGGPPAPEALDRARRLAAPIVISQPHSVYRVSGPLWFPGTAFYVAAEDVTLDLNGHTVYFAGEKPGHAVRLYLAWAQEPLPPPSISNPGEPRGFRVTNGCLVQVGAEGHGVTGFRGHDARIDGVYIEVAGPDAAAIAFDNAGCQISDCVLVARDTQPTDRHAGPALVRVPEGAVTAENNALLGGNSSFNVGSHSKLRRNLLSPDCRVTNGYAVWLYRKDGVECVENLILPVNGRGVLLNAGQGNRVVGNVALAWERPNEEYGAHLNAGAMRLRYEAADNRVEGNCFLAVGGGDRTAGTALYLSNTASGVSTFIDNDCLALLSGDPQHADHYAKALGFESPDPKPTRDVIAKNRFAGNHWLLSTSGPDGGSDQGPIVGNEFTWIDGPAAYARFTAAIDKLRALPLPILEHPVAAQRCRSVLADLNQALDQAKLREDRRTMYARAYDIPEAVTVLDSSGDAGWSLADLHIAGKWAAPASIRIGRTQRVQCVDEQGRPLARQPLAIRGAGDLALDAATDAEGWVELPLVERWLDKPAGEQAAWSERQRSQATIELRGYASVTIELVEPPERLDFQRLGSRERERPE